MKASLYFGFAILLALIPTRIVAAQTETTAEPSPASQVRAGTQMKAQLESTIDSKTAKPGDEVRARVAEDVKQDGKIVIRKGSRLVGHVTEAQAASDANASSSSNSAVAVEFDRLVQGKAISELNTVVSAVVMTPAERRANLERSAAEPAMPPPSPTRSASGNGGGGLLGGVSSTVGSTIGTTVGTTGSVLGGAGEALGASAISLGTTARTIQLGSEGQASQSGTLTSVFRTDQDRLRLESGTMLEFRVASETEAREKRE